MDAIPLFPGTLLVMSVRFTQLVEHQGFADAGSCRMGFLLKEEEEQDIAAACLAAATALLNEPLV